MHLMMMLLALGLAWLIRSLVPYLGKFTGDKWARSLFLLGFSPIIMGMTAISVICMGYQGQMLGIDAGWLSYTLATIWLVCGNLYLIKQIWLAYLSQKQIRQLPQRIVLGKIVRILPTAFPYSAQIGFWRSQLVISQGLLDSLDEQHLEAVLAHEQAHAHYRDTFWFFWLNWLKVLTSWLPYTEALWQELLFLREIRADEKAKESVDSLVLAESLLQVVQQATNSSSGDITKGFSAAFNSNLLAHRLEERINNILDESNPNFQLPWYVWVVVFCSLLPFLAIPLHYSNPI